VDVPQHGGEVAGGVEFDVLDLGGQPPGQHRRAVRVVQRHHDQGAELEPHVGAGQHRRAVGGEPALVGRAGPGQ
jgi:hypothetical protein